jgi:hypothetical protein
MAAVCSLQTLRHPQNLSCLSLIATAASSSSPFFFLFFFSSSSQGASASTKLM